MFSSNELTKLVSTYELPGIETADDSAFGSLRFVIQIFQLPDGAFVPRVLRKDRVEVTPAYYKQREALLDHATAEIVVPDDSFEWELLVSLSESEALQRALGELGQLLAL